MVPTRVLRRVATFAFASSLAWTSLFGLLSGAEQFQVIPSFVDNFLVLIGLSSVSLIVGIAAVVLEAQREREKKLFVVFKTSAEYFKAVEDIHSRHSRVLILARTPGLILPSERTMTREREHYWSQVKAKLHSGEGNYHLKYLFDIDGFKSIVRQYRDENDAGKLENVRELVMEALKNKNLDLRYAKTGPLSSAVIGGDDVICIGFREEASVKLSEGALIAIPEIVKMLRVPYDSLFNSSPRVGTDFFENVLKEVNETRGP
jgi:hypothetical protein